MKFSFKILSFIVLLSIYSDLLLGQNIKLDTVVVPTKGNDFAKPLSISLRPDDATNDETNKIRERNVLPYQNVRDEDAIYKQRIWRVIDCREKINQPMSYLGLHYGGDQRLFSIIYRAIMAGDVVAFEDDRFTLPISLEKFTKNYSGGWDTLLVRGDLENPDRITGVQIREIEFPVDSVYRFQLKEEVFFDKATSRLYTRILGIAPMMPPMFNGRIIEGVPTEPFPRFWVYYPDIRATLAKYTAYNPQNWNSTMTWEDVFEARYFSSYIVKTTLDNPNDLPLKETIKDPLFRLYQGEKIKNKIFNYEQGLWSY
ncbi:MAG: gliding motility protein GldN [Phycisphaerales bacterium]|nr:gliding motility protein GldN [Phycisphaerales bacterium]